MSADSTPHSTRDDLMSELQAIAELEPRSVSFGEVQELMRERARLRYGRDSLEEQYQALREAVAAAMTSLSTGPMKDGYAYSVLEEATADPNPADSPNKAAGGWCELHGGYLGQRCATCALEVADSAPASGPDVSERDAAAGHLPDSRSETSERVWPCIEEG